MVFSERVLLVSSQLQKAVILCGLLCSLLNHIPTGKALNRVLLLMGSTSPDTMACHSPAFSRDASFPM